MDFPMNDRYRYHFSALLQAFSDQPQYSGDLDAVITLQ